MTKTARAYFVAGRVFLAGAALAALVLPGCSESSKAVTVTASNFEEVVLKSKKPVLVDFWKEQCPPCTMMDPVIRELANEFEGKAIVARINGEDYMQISEKYGIEGFPTFLVFKDGQLKRRFVGVTAKYILSDQLGVLR